MSKYKYLGTYLDPKLTMRNQIDWIRRKSDCMFVKLYPYLVNATAGGRKDMLRTMVCPLFNALLVLTYFEESKSNNQIILRLWHSTFKKFMLIPKTTNTQLVDEMIGIDFEELNFITTQNSARKWFARFTRSEPDLLVRERPIDYLKGIPKDWCEILKQQCGLCPICKNTSRNAKHLEEKHGIEILSYQDIWNAIKTTFNKESEKQQKQNIFQV